MTESGEAVPRPKVQRSASAFDAARSGSWHYYRPVAMSRSSSTSQDTTTEVTSPSVAPVSSSSNRTQSPSGRPTRRVFDAANPSTWNRQGRVHYTSTPSETLARTESSSSQPSQQRTATSGTSAQPSSLEEWNVYLASAGVSSRERGEILADIFGNMRRSSPLGLRRPTVAVESSPLRRQRALHEGPFARSGPSARFPLDDPDFGDTSAYWEALSGQSGSSRGIAGLWASRSATNAATRTADGSATPVPHLNLPRQPTHLNYAGLAPQVATVRRRSSIASIASYRSNCTLPEYSATGSTHTLPHYRPRTGHEDGITA